MRTLQQFLRLFRRYRLQRSIELLEPSFRGSDTRVLFEMLEDEGLVDGVVLAWVWVWILVWQGASGEVACWVCWNKRGDE